MSIVRDDCDERQIRVDRMVEEFRTAQSRRLAKAITVKGDDHVVELQRNASSGVAVDRSTTASTSHSNG
jgi:LDH2 family malate/lactate/ureidoglycolate dehydrogenase